MMKVVIKVYLDGRRCLPKPLRIMIYMLKLIFPHDVIWKRSNSTAKLKQDAMKIAVASPGVESVAFEEDRLVVTGEKIDACDITQSLRRNVGFALIASLE